MLCTTITIVAFGELVYVCMNIVILLLFCDHVKEFGAAHGVLALDLVRHVVCVSTCIVYSKLGRCTLTHVDCMQAACS